jgi:hypothetical protein
MMTPAALNAGDRDEATARGIAAPDISECLATPDTPPPSTATVDTSTRRRSRRLLQLTNRNERGTAR